MGEDNTESKPTQKIPTDFAAYQNLSLLEKMKLISQNFHLLEPSQIMTVLWGEIGEESGEGIRDTAEKILSHTFATVFSQVSLCLDLLPRIPDLLTKKPELSIFAGSQGEETIKLAIKLTRQMADFYDGKGEKPPEGYSSWRDFA